MEEKSIFSKPKFPIQSQRSVWFLNEYCAVINCHKSYFSKQRASYVFFSFFLKNTKVAFRNFCLIHIHLPIKILYKRLKETLLSHTASYNIIG
jgi:hypothetical protein